MSLLARIVVVAVTALAFSAAPATARASDGPATVVEVAKGAGYVGGGVATAALGAVVAVGAGATVAMTTLTVGTAIGLGIGYGLIIGGVALAGYGLYRGGKALHGMMTGSNVRRSDDTRSRPVLAPAGGSTGGASGAGMPR